MSLGGRLFRPRAAITTSHQLATELGVAGIGGLKTSSGATVTPESAMQVSAVFACVRVLAEGVAQLPLLVYRTTERGRERATDHWLYRLLHDQPNAWQTSFEWRETQQAHLALWGNSFSIQTVARGETRELLPVPPPRVQVQRVADGSPPIYTVTGMDGVPFPVPASRMLHVPALSLDGVTGLSPVAYARETIGVAQQQLQHAGQLFANGTRLSGVLEHPQKLSPAAAQRLRDQFDAIYAGVGNWWKTAILEEGLKWSQAGMNAEEAQFLEQRKYSDREIARLYRVQPHLIGDLERATFSNIEQQSIEHVVYTLMPWLRRLEGRLNRQLVPEVERATLTVEFLVDGLLRGDFKARTEGYQRAILSGWLNRNEARRLENLNPVDGLDTYLEPQNMAPAGFREEPPAREGEA